MKNKLGLCSTLLALPFATNLVNAGEKPNVVLIYTDDVGYGDLECYGNTQVPTPNINALAKSGIKFTNAYATAATSTPSRYSLLTGEYAWRKEGTDIAAGNAGMIIRPEQYTTADLFKNSGYVTGAIGKWHLGLGDKAGEQDWNAPLPTNLADLGFDYSYIMAATADRVPCVFIENGQVANYDPENPIYVSYEKPFEGEPLAKDHPELLFNQKSSVGHNMAIVNGIGRIGYMKGGGKALWKDENIADSITVHATNFIEKNKENPFFLYLATNDIHVPRFPHKRFRGTTPLGVRGDAIAQLDWVVGKVVRSLDSLGLRDNTLIILSSDNGPVVDDGYADGSTEALNGHKPAGPHRGSKYSSFEGGTAVPFIVSWPKKIKGYGISNALVSQIDFFKTMATLLGAKIPTGFAPDSENYLSTWLGKSDQGRDYVVQQSFNHTLSIRTPKWKYIDSNNGEKMLSWCPEVETGNNPLPQLYEIEQDVTETQNKAMDYPAIVYKLQNILKTLVNKK